MKIIIAIGLTVMLAACSGSAPRLQMFQIKSKLTLPTAVGSAIVRKVSLPTYAASEELSIETTQGLIVSNKNILWADDPARAVTLALARNLGEIVDAKIVPHPWPFVDLPDVAIDIRVTRMIAAADGIFYLEGQYFVGGDGIAYKKSTNRFAVQAQIQRSEPAGISDAQARALLTLAELIAHKIAQ